MKKTQIGITAAMVLAVISASAANSRGQTKLEDKGGLGRLIGNWIYTTDDGGTFDLSFKWGLNKHVVISRFEMAGRYSGFGLVYYDPAKGKIVHAGIDSVGGLGRGFWQVGDDKAVWKMNYVGPNSEQRKMGIVYTRSSAKTLKMEYFGLDDNGELAGEPQRTTEFQRKAKVPAKKDKTRKKQPADSSAYTALSGLVDTGGFDWIIGNWVTATYEGQSFDVAYKWGMGKNLINMTSKGGEHEGLGMIFYAPEEGRVMHFGVDNQGGVTKGIWDADGDKLVATLDFATLGGNSNKIAIVHTNIDAETINVAFYGVDESGGRSAEPWASLEYKRRARKTAAKLKSDNKPKTE
ncbi:MAG: hypothetical protein ISS79_10660 [Phycisphaerae bacterium]|nr:hypothetical protein [Phycisphaerae bacterium]